MNPDQMVVTAVEAAERDRAVAAVVLAFGTDPVARWVFRDSQEYLSSFPLVVGAFGGNAFAHATGHQVSGFRGVALWLPPDVHPDHEALGSIVEKTVTVDRHEEVFGLFDQMASFHPHEPHWYLPMIGVDPAYQRKGYGSALLQHALQACDADHLPAYLESSNPVNVPLYERHGFVVMGTIQAASSPPLFPMIRAAR